MANGSVSAEDIPNAGRVEVSGFTIDHQYFWAFQFGISTIYLDDFIRLIIVVIGWNAIIADPGLFSVEGKTIF